MMQGNNSVPPNEAASTEGRIIEQRPPTTPKDTGKEDQQIEMEVKGNEIKAETEQFNDHLKVSSQINMSEKKKEAFFDFANPPEKVTWILTDAKHNVWCLFINGTMVPDAERELWKKALIFHLNANSRKTSLSQECSPSNETLHEHNHENDAI